MKDGTILLVEDEALAREATCRLLHRRGLHVLQARAATEALDILERGEVDVIVSDENMPGLTGTELLTLANQRFPRTMRILLTGHASLDVAMRAINDGAVFRFLTKPCPPLVLVQAVRDALQQRDLLDASYRLLSEYESRTGALEDLEREYPGITHVERTASGAVKTQAPSLDPEQLIDRIMRAVQGPESARHPG